MQVSLRRGRLVLGRYGSALLGAALLSGCGAAAPGIAGVPGLRESASSSYVSGDASIQVLAAEDRGAPVVGLSGPTLAGEDLDTTAFRGDVVVLNVWGSWCAPCHEEAPELVAAQEELQASEELGTAVRFVGINIRDRSREAALAFEEQYGVTWPSLYDPGSLLLLPLADDIPPNAVPTTLVLDEEGRVSARMVGAVDAATLVGVVEQVVGVGSGR